jgi:hypothetical protein
MMDNHQAQDAMQDARCAGADWKGRTEMARRMIKEEKG